MTCDMWRGYFLGYMFNQVSIKLKDPQIEFDKKIDGTYFVPKSVTLLLQILNWSNMTCGMFLRVFLKVTCLLFN